MKAQVTFEYATRAPQTARFVDIGTRTPSAAASRAIRQAKAALHPINWTSVVVLLERGETEPEEAERD